MMFYGQNNNNQNDAVSTNTTIISFYSDLSSLTIGAWNDKINLRFNPANGKDGNGMTMYDRENKKSTAISQANATLLLLQIKEKILPMIKEKDNKTPVSTGIMIGRPDSQNALMVEYKPSEEGEFSVYLTLFQNVSQYGNKNKVTYVFNKGDSVLLNSSGEEIENDPEKHESEFLTFMDILDHHMDILPMTAHAIRHSNAIGKRISNNYQNNNSGNNSGFGNMSDFPDPDELPFN